jgi:hypothetical protein
MNSITFATDLLTSMITPAILIVACGSLSLTTSQRLSRNIERTRKISYEFKEIRNGKNTMPVKEQQMLYRQLKMAIRRSALLQRSMTFLYIALGLFISTSLVIGLYQIINRDNIWLLVVLPLLGALALLTSSIILIMETRLALRAVDDEMNFRLQTLYEHHEAELKKQP